jgi:hypothetical protein
LPGNQCDLIGKQNEDATGQNSREERQVFANGACIREEPIQRYDGCDRGEDSKKGKESDAA